MNKTQLEAIEESISNAEDNLYRAQMQQPANPKWVSGNGESINSIVAQYEQHLRELKE